MSKVVNFQQLKNLFDPQEWDVGILSDDYYDECMNSPIKAVSHPYGIDMSKNPISSYITAHGKDIKSFLVLAKKSLTDLIILCLIFKIACCFFDLNHKCLLFIK